jgi:hypothetical protein
VSGDSQFEEPLRRRFDFEWILLRVQAGADLEPRGGGGPADHTEDLVAIGERLGGPVPADLAEQAAFNRNATVSCLQSHSRKTSTPLFKEQAVVFTKRAG